LPATPPDPAAVARALRSLDERRHFADAIGAEEIDSARQLSFPGLEVVRRRVDAKLAALRVRIRRDAAQPL
jgi:hypothetical protein